MQVVVSGHQDKLAELLGFAARVLREDRGYQRELEVWTAHTHGWNALGDGVAEDALSPEAPPVAVLADRSPRRTCCSSAPTRHEGRPPRGRRGPCSAPGSPRLPLGELFPEGPR
ncbi:hypothetical protein [Amycolatopsis kentuckyensis]|uniref:hypothetical protein n=1 Tax=Amycolatopsis kentuckyensis TaxID=218823 RepID=UPI003566CC42